MPSGSNELEPRPTETLRVLVIDDPSIDAGAIVRVLQSTGKRVEIERVPDARELQAAVNARPYDVVVSEAAPDSARKVSHDFINMFSVMLSYVEFVLAELPAEHTARRDVESLRRVALKGMERARQLQKRE